MDSVEDIPLRTSQEEEIRIYDLAVYGNSLCKSYGPKRRKQIVLDYLNITVKKGCVYGLLGSSGSGKTTLLKCIVGCKKLDRGQLWVLGGQPGDSASGVPGPRVGYMPQEVGLLKGSSVKEAILYAARISGLKTASAQDQYDFLVTLLDLPSSNRIIKELSMGEQRRVSLAIALVHKPDLLVLDEPTVGIDPSTTTKIWDHLVNISEKEKECTVMITTHYIEEASRASIVGIMRNGKILTEISPAKLLEATHCETLEDAFVLVSYQQDNSDLEPNLFQEGQQITVSPVAASSKKCKSPLRGYRMKELILRNTKQLLRNPSQIIFSYLFPIIEIVVFFWTIGGDPHDLSVGILDKELFRYNKKECPEEMNYVNKDSSNKCNLNLLSCLYLEKLPGTIDKVFFESEADLIQKSKAGDLYATIEFADNFTNSFLEMQDSKTRIATVAEKTIENSQILVHLDMTDRQTGMYLRYKLSSAFISFKKDALNQCIIPLPNQPHQLIQFQEPVYGSMYPRFEEFMIPGVMITLSFFLQGSLTTVTLILERTQGLWDRNVAAGVTVSEIILSHTVTQTFFCFTQVLLQMIVVYGLYKINVEGCYVSIFIIIFLQSICGQSLGFLISVSTGSIMTANYIMTGSFYPVLLLSGVIWPIESMPHGLQIIARLSPLTMSISAVRNISEKGWTISDPGVYWGVVYPLIWVCLLRLSTWIVTFQKTR